MHLKWLIDDADGDIDLLDYGKLAGWVEPVKGEYRVNIVSTLSADTLPCEEQNFVTLREAMRALKETVTVLLIGREYGT